MDSAEIASQRLLRYSMEHVAGKCKHSRVIASISGMDSTSNKRGGCSLRKNSAAMVTRVILSAFVN